MWKFVEKNRILRCLEIVALVVTLLLSSGGFFFGFQKVNAYSGSLTYVGEVELQRQFDQEDYDDDSRFCDVIYADGEKKMIVKYSYEDYLELTDDTLIAYEYVADDGVTLCFDHPEPSFAEAKAAYKDLMSSATMTYFNVGTSCLILALSVALMLVYAGFFTTYEKCWFLLIMLAATIVSVLFPEESANGVNGIVIMLLYLLDTFFNILCELLISKQSRYNFLVSVVVEILEIAICIVLMYRFATMVSTLFFWLPIDILSFINWSKHKDDREDELTKVRKLKGYQEVLVILAIALWTVVVGYFLSGLDIATDFFGGNRTLTTIVTYLDACASAVGVANGLFIFFRMQEQWIAWYVCAILEAVINIVSGQYVLLVLKVGYLTNSTYGYIKWNRYIKTHQEEKLTLL